MIIIIFNETKDFNENFNGAKVVGTGKRKIRNKYS